MSHEVDHLEIIHRGGQDPRGQKETMVAPTLPRHPTPSHAFPRSSDPMHLFTPYFDDQGTSHVPTLTCRDGEWSLTPFPWAHNSLDFSHKALVADEGSTARRTLFPLTHERGKCLLCLSPHIRQAFVSFCLGPGMILQLVFNGMSGGYQYSAAGRVHQNATCQPKTEAGTVTSLHSVPNAQDGRLG